MSSPAVKAAEDPSVRLRRTRTLFLPGDGADARRLAARLRDAAATLVRGVCADRGIDLP